MGTGKAFHLTAVHEVVRAIGPSKAAALPAFHAAFTGCDQISSFAGKGKCSAWETWKSFEVVTPALEALSDSPSENLLQQHAICWRCSQKKLSRWIPLIPPPIK